jgi:hypothetical protein
MIRMIQPHSALARSELDEIKRMLRWLKSSRAQTRFAVGAGVWLAEANCMCQFGGRQSFCQIPSGDRK